MKNSKKTIFAISLFIAFFSNLFSINRKLNYADNLKENNRTFFHNIVRKSYKKARWNVLKISATENCVSRLRVTLSRTVASQCLS